MMNRDLLSNVAERLTSSLQENEGHLDVKELLGNPGFMKILSLAVRREITVPVDLGMGYWLLESNLRDIPALSALFSVSYLLLEGVNSPLVNRARDKRVRSVPRSGGLQGVQA